MSQQQQQQKKKKREFDCTTPPPMGRPNKRLTCTTTPPHTTPSGQVHNTVSPILQEAQSGGGVSSDLAPFLVVGDVVDVVPRTWPGINKPGGVGKISRINSDGTFNVTYVLGGSEKKVELQYIRTSASMMQTLQRPKKSRDFFINYRQDPPGRSLKRKHSTSTRGSESPRSMSSGSSASSGVGSPRCEDMEEDGSPPKARRAPRRVASVSSLSSRGAPDSPTLSISSRTSTRGGSRKVDRQRPKHVRFRLPGPDSPASEDMEQAVLVEEEEEEEELESASFGRPCAEDQKETRATPAEVPRQTARSAFTPLQLGEVSAPSRLPEPSPSASSARARARAPGKENIPPKKGDGAAQGRCKEMHGPGGEGRRKTVPALASRSAAKAKAPGKNETHKSGLGSGSPMGRARSGRGVSGVSGALYAMLEAQRVKRMEVERRLVAEHKHMLRSARSSLHQELARGRAPQGSVLERTCALLNPAWLARCPQSASEAEVEGRLRARFARAFALTEERQQLEVALLQRRQRTELLELGVGLTEEQIDTHELCPLVGVPRSSLVR